MTLFLLILLITYFDPNIGFANSLTVLLLVVDFGLLCFRKRIKLSKGLGIMALFFAAVFLSFIVNGGNYEIVMFVAASVGIYILAFNWFSDEYSIQQLLICIVRIGVILSICGIVEFFLPSFNAVLAIFRTTTTPVFIENGITRICATFINPILLSMVLAVSIVITQCLMHQNNNKKNRKLKSALILQIVVFVLTLSEGGVIALIIAESVYFFVRKNFPLVKVVKIVTPIIAVLGLLSVAIMPRLVSLENLLSIFTARVYAWTVSLRMFSSNWLTGIGPGNFNPNFRTYGYEFISKYYFEIYNTHSDYLNVLSSTGLIGFVIFIVFTLYFLRMVFSVLNYKVYCNPKTQVVFWLAIAIVYIFLHRAVDDFVFNVRQLILINTILASFEVQYINKKREGLIG